MDFIPPGDGAPVGVLIMVDGMIRSGIRSILTGDPGVQVGELAGPTAEAGVTAAGASA